MGNWPSLEKNNPIISLTPKKKTNRNPTPVLKIFDAPSWNIYPPPPFMKILQKAQLSTNEKKQTKSNENKLETSFIWLDKRIMQCLFKEV